jgi:hypothetical protein
MRYRELKSETKLKLIELIGDRKSVLGKLDLGCSRLVNGGSDTAKQLSPRRPKLVIG